MIATPRRFSAELLRRSFAHFHHVKCDLDQNSSTAVRHHVSVNHFLSAVLQCHVVRCHSFDVCRTHHWKLRCKPWWADMSKTSRIDHQLVLLSMIPRLIFPIHCVPDVSCCLPAKISRVPHLRIQSCSLETDSAAGFRLTAVTFTDFCHVGFRLSRALAFTLSLGGCLYQQSAALCPYFPQFRHSPSNRECSVVVSP